MNSTTKVWTTENGQTFALQSHQLFRLILEMSGLRFQSQPLYMDVILRLLKYGVENAYPEATQVQVLDPREQTPEWITVIWL